MALHTYGDGGSSYSGFPSLQPTSGYRWFGQSVVTGLGGSVLEDNYWSWQQNGTIRLNELNNTRVRQSPNLPIPIKAGMLLPKGVSWEVAVSRASVY